MPKAKSPKKAALPLKDRAIRAALDLAAEQGWAETSLEDVAGRCKCSLSNLQAIFKDRTDILIAYADQVGQMVADRVTADLNSSERDRLFDVMMERFDILNEDREAILSVMKSLQGDPKQALSGLPHLGQSMLAMLDAAEIKSSGLCGAITAIGLTGVYLFTLKAWIYDENVDMAKTMAALDRALEKTEKTANFLKL
jgi:ubiquinone biosynthesis protein COQ9